MVGPLNARTLGLTVLLLACLACSDESGSRAVRAHEPLKVDLGFVGCGHEKEVQISAHNDSEASWEIQDVRVSCSCLTVLGFDDRVASGGKLSVNVHVGNRTGGPAEVRHVSESVTAIIESNGETSRLQWRISVALEPCPVVSRSFGETAALPDGTFELDLGASVPAGREPAARPRFLRERSVSYGLSGVDVEFREDADDNDPGPRNYLVKITGKVDLDRAGGWGSLWVDLGIGAAHPIGITVDNPHFFSLSPRVLALARGVERAAIEVRGGEGWNSHDLTAVVVPESLGKAVYQQEEGRIYLRVAGSPPRSGLLRISSSGKGGRSHTREIPVILDF